MIESRFADRPSLFHPRRAVVVSDDGLISEYPFGLRTTTPWRLVVGVRMARHGQAELELVGGARLRLPGSGDELQRLIRAIDRQCARQSGPPQGSAVTEVMVGEWLNLPAGQRIEEDANVPARVFGPLLLLCGALLLGLRADDLAPGCLCLTLGLILTIGGYLSLLSYTRVTRHGIVHRSAGREWSVAWRSIVAARCRDRDRDSITIDLTTREGTFSFSAPAYRFERVAEAAERAARVNTARLRGRAVSGVPDTALSPARLAGEEDAEHGLSRSVEP